MKLRETEEKAGKMKVVQSNREKCRSKSEAMTAQQSYPTFDIGYLTLS